ncbi:MAG: DVU_1551 family NTP transferase [Desulfitobacteriaceae bacterium]
MEQLKSIEVPGVAAVVVAAGFSFRMKAFKPLLPLQGEPVIVRAVANLKAAGIEDIRVVVGHKAQWIIPLLQRLKVAVIINEHYAEGMFSSVQTGVAQLPSATKGFLLLPADMPLVKPKTIKQLLAVFKSSPGIVYPCYQGVRGHPPVIDASYIPAILNWREDGGLRALLSRFEGDAVDEAVDDRGVLLDMDTLEDYIQLSAYDRVEAPSVEECYLLLEQFKVPERVRQHGLAVAAVACELGRQLNAAGCRLNLELLYAAGILHDMAKGEREHAQAGARLLTQYPAVAGIVAVHTDITLEPDQDLSEKDIIYLADKLVQEDQLVGLQIRFGPGLEKFKNEPVLRQKVLERWQNAHAIKERIEESLNSSLEMVWPEHLRGKAHGRY